MKNLELISFVGVDTETDMKNLANLRWNTPIALEFSVLYSDSKSVGNYTRYPSYKFCKDFLDSCPAQGIYGSLHLCGSVIERYLKQEEDVMNLCKNAYRIQLNFNINHYSNYSLLTDRIVDVINKQNHKVILQQNKSKKDFLDIFLAQDVTTASVSLLHDSSGGFGREITQVSAPHEKYMTGYAGGINPDNVAKIVKLIEETNTNNRPYYIDMESGIRTDNIFSLEKCQQVVNNLQ